MDLLTSERCDVLKAFESRTSNYHGSMNEYVWRTDKHVYKFNDTIR